MRKYYYFYYQRVPDMQNEFLYISAHCFPAPCHSSIRGMKVVPVTVLHILLHSHVLFLMNLHLQFVLNYRRGEALAGF